MKNQFLENQNQIKQELFLIRINQIKVDHGIKKDEKKNTKEEHRKDEKKNDDKILDEESPDAIVLQGGSIEITNFDVNEAMTDTDKDINEYRKQWAFKVEEDSNNLFALIKILSS